MHYVASRGVAVGRRVSSLGSWVSCDQGRSWRPLLSIKWSETVLARRRRQTPTAHRVKVPVVCCLFQNGLLSVSLCSRLTTAYSSVCSLTVSSTVQYCRIPNSTVEYRTVRADREHQRQAREQAERRSLGGGSEDGAGALLPLAAGVVRETGGERSVGVA